MGTMARIFNIMQYERHPETGEELFSEDNIKKALEHKTIKRYAYALHDKDLKEDGTPKGPHWHIVIETGTNRMDIADIAKWFNVPENFVNIARGRGAFLDCVEYLTHEDEKQILMGKYRYRNEDVVSNFPWRKELDERQLNKLKYGTDLSIKDRFRLDVLDSGKTLKQCYEEDKVNYVTDLDKLKKLRLEYIDKQHPPKFRINYYITGGGGSGKGLMSRALARSLFPDKDDDYDIFFEVGAPGSAFEGYDGQPCIIWNDRRSCDLLHELNGRGNVFNIFDTFPTKQKQNIKYGSINLCNKVNIVNSVETYEDFLNGLTGEIEINGKKQKSEDKKQGYRRFPIIIPIAESDFSILLNKGFMNDSNEYDEFFLLSRVRANFRNIVKSIPNPELVRLIEDKTIKPLTDISNEIIKKYELQSSELTEEQVFKMFSDYGQEIKDCDFKDA